MIWLQGGNSWKGFNREALVSIRDFDTGIVPPITITNDRPFTSRLVKLYQIREGVIQPCTGPIEPFFDHFDQLIKEGIIVE